MADELNADLPRRFLELSSDGNIPRGSLHRNAAGQQDERDQPHPAGKVIELEEAVTGEDLKTRTARISDEFDMIEGEPDP